MYQGTQTSKNLMGGGYKNTVNIISGGFPCQPYSQAGSRKGKEDERHLWPEMLRTIGEIQPSWVIGENVPGILNWNRGVVLHEIKTDLEGKGFEVFPPCVLPACGLNANHRRERLWIIAYSENNRQNIRKVNRDGCEGENIKSEQSGNNEVWSEPVRYNRISSDTNIGRQQECRQERFTPIQFAQDNRLASEPGVRRGIDGFSNRVDRLKGLGNAIVPQVAFEIFKAIEQFENNLYRK
ncbi:MAG: putative cytosine-specific methylase [Chitinophagaceae bacterium]|nr:putative cytosine-specific methylase [Chitinophagaceae bacterium]